jgi:hypothetical protein
MGAQSKGGTMQPTAKPLRIPGLADMGGGHYAILGTRAPCDCTLQCRTPFTIVKRQKDGDAEPRWHLLTARGDTYFTYVTLRRLLLRFSPAEGPMARWLLDPLNVVRLDDADVAAPIERVWHEQPYAG